MICSCRPQVRVFMLVAVLCVSMFCAWRAALAADNHPQFAGDWVLDRHNSDDIGKKLKARDRHWFGGLFAPSPPRNDDGSDNSDSPRDQDEADSDGDGDTTSHGAAYSWVGVPGLQHELFESDRMHFEQHDGLYRITYADGKAREVRHDDPGRTSSASGEFREGKFGYSIAYWENATLVFETHTDSGKQTLERYTLQKDGHQLLMEIVLDAAHQSEPLVLRRVFDRAPP